jgi:hypothetical protein
MYLEFFLDKPIDNPEKYISIVIKNNEKEKKLKLNPKSNIQIEIVAIMYRNKLDILKVSKENFDLWVDKLCFYFFCS